MYCFIKFIVLLNLLFYFNKQERVVAPDHVRTTIILGFNVSFTLYFFIV